MYMYLVWKGNMPVPLAASCLLVFRQQKKGLERWMFGGLSGGLGGFAPRLVMANTFLAQEEPTSPLGRRGAVSLSLHSVSDV